MSSVAARARIAAKVHRTTQRRRSLLRRGGVVGVRYSAAAESLGAC
jgi:hypothetical protein